MKSKIILALLLFFTGIISNAQSRVVLTIKTGSDDLALRDFQENPRIRIKVQGKAEVFLENANRSRPWRNNSISTVTIPLDPSTVVEEIKEISIIRQNKNGWNSFDDGIADNWNLQKVDVVAYILKDGSTAKYNLGSVQGNPYYRFIYGPQDNATQGKAAIFSITQHQLLSTTNADGLTISPTRPSTPVVADRTVHAPSVIVSPPSDNKIDIDLKTGSDNLEMKQFQDNVEIRILIQNKPDVILLNANKGQNWPNNSIRRVTIPLPPDITAEAIKEIHIYRLMKGAPKYLWEIGDLDNWNLQSINAFATIKINGTKKRYDFEPIVPTAVPGRIFRFVADYKAFSYSNPATEYEGEVYKKVLTLKTATLPAPVNTDVPAQNAKLDIAIGTGGDDLRGGNDNADIVLTFKSHPGKVYLRNIFNGRKLSNFSERKVVKEITNSTTIDINDIKEVELLHTGGGGIGADNWDIDKVKISIIKDGQTKVLADRVGAPIHRFTGDTRVKRFQVQ